MAKPFYSTAGVARLCQVSRGSVLRWIHDGQLKAATTVGGHHRIQLADLLELIQKLELPLPDEIKSAHVPETIKKILIVEDDSDISRLIRQSLRTLPCRAVFEVASDGLQAGWILSRFVPDLVMLDLHLPKIDGYDVCQFIRSEAIFKETKIIAMSTPDPEKEARILNLGADVFLSKPCSPAQIEEIVRKQLYLDDKKTILKKRGSR